MSRLLLMIAVVLAASSHALGQSSGSSIADLRQSSVRVDSIPVSDKLAVQKSPTAQSSSKAGTHNHTQDSVDDKDEAQGRFWGSAEYLLWRMKKSNLPPLITTGPDTSEAIIGEPGTVIAFGGNKLDRGKFPGGRFTVGVWLNKKRNVGVELSYFFLKERMFNFQVSSNGLPGSLAISRSYFDILRNTEGVVIVAFPNDFRFSIPPEAQSGSVTATLPSRLQGAESNIIYKIRNSHCCRINLLTGFRYLNFNEGLTITNITDTSNGVHYSETDQFSTRNQFYGGQAGAHITFGQRRLSLELSTKVAIGVNRENVDINGTTFHNTHLQFNVRGGLLAVESNIGQYLRSEFTTVPEVRAQFVYKFTRYLHALVGYDFLYWNKVVRPGEQIDRNVNELLVPLFSGTSPIVEGPLRPAFTFRDTGFWVQGLNIGIQTRF
jgi:hypothetical protein